MSGPGPPHGWVESGLGDVADIQLGKMLDRKRTDGRLLPYLRNINVRWGHIDTSDLLEMPFKPHEEERYEVRPGDVLVCEGGEPGRAAVWTRRDLDVKYQKALHRVRLRGGILQSWLVYQLQLDAATGALSRHFTGTTIGHLPLEAIEEYGLRIAPLPEQQRIVAAIDDYSSRLDEAVALLERAQRNLKRYRASALKAAVEGRLVPIEADLARAEGRSYEPASVLLERILEERRRRWKAEGRRGTYKEPVAPDTTDLPELPEGWCWATWGQVGLSQNGRAFPSKEYQGFGVRLLRPGNLHESGRVEWTPKNTRCLPDEWAEEYPSFLVIGNELVMNLTAQSLRDEFLGRICMTGPDERCLLNQRIARLSPIGLNPRYALWLFKSPLFRRFVDGLNTGSLIQHMFTSQLAEFVLPLPPLHEQARLVAEIEHRMSVVESATLDLDHNLARATRLRQSILKWAFEGRLVDQDPSDEPAAVLLERIRAERERAGATGGSVRRSRRSTRGGA